MRAETQLHRRIQAFDRWKGQLLEAVERLQAWLDTHGQDDGERTLRLFEAAQALRHDRLNIAFVAEFSRGKTELINAIFFADYHRRLLPSGTGRTTMCPTELFYDRETDEAYVRLLPIETRLDETSLAEYRHDPAYWTHIPLETDAPEQMAAALGQVVRTKVVSADEAAALGLGGAHLRHESGGVEIPVWRHALISFPHPLLQDGLVIVDTPGLNAVGAEPELTMSLLPAAQAVVFVLSADTGVTRSDLDMWQHHIDGARRSRRQKGVAVVLNKIDTLWDELQGESAVASSIDSQVRKTATLLGIHPEAIFPVSAQKGLLGKIRGDGALLGRSRLQALEDYLSDALLPARQAIVRDTIVGDVSALVEDELRVLHTRLQHTGAQLRELRALSGKNADVIVHLMKKTREEQIAYQANLESFQASRRLLQRRASALLASLGMEQIDRLIGETRKSMMGSWTTAGLRRAMHGFFEGTRAVMDRAAEEAEQTCRLVTAIYKKFQAEHGLPAMEARMFSAQEHTRRMEQLYAQAEAFRKSPMTAMTEQGFVVKKFFIGLVSQTRNTLFKANQDAESWLREVMNPLSAQLKEHKAMMERRLHTLRRISESRDTLDGKLEELVEEQRQLETQIATLEDVRARLLAPAPLNPSSAA